MLKVNEEFNYDSFFPEKRQRIQEITAEINQLLRWSVSNTINISLSLIEAKQHLGHGHFGEWLAMEFEWSERTAQNFMNVAKNFNYETISDLPINANALYALAAQNAPEDARKEAILLAESGETISLQIAKDIIKNHIPKELDSLKDGDLAPAKPAFGKQTGEPTTGIPNKVMRLVDQGAIGLSLAQQIIEQLSDAPNSVRQVVEQYGLSDPEIIPILVRLANNGSSTFAAILASGYIPTPDESIPIWEATHRELQKVLDYASYEHKKVALQRKKQQRQSERREKLQQLRDGDPTKVIITDQLSDLNSDAEACLLFFIPDQLDLETLTRVFNRDGYKLLGALAYRGNPLLNVGGRIVTAEEAVFYIEDAAETLMTSICDIRDETLTEDRNSDSA